MRQITKKTLKIIVFVLLFIVLFIIATILVLKGVWSMERQQAFARNRDLVLEYVARQYDFECPLVKHRIGNDAYPASRQSDTFVFYDTVHNKYFKVFCDDTGYIVDMYEYATAEEPDLDY